LSKNVIEHIKIDWTNQCRPTNTKDTRCHQTIYKVSFQEIYIAFGNTARRYFRSLILQFQHRY